MDKTKYLTDLGLSEQEAAVYLALLEIGGGSASMVAKTAKMQRTAVYPILKVLANKGCVLVYFRKNRYFYYAQNPRKLRKIFEDKLQSFDKLIPFLELSAKMKSSIPGLRFIETQKELEQFYADVLDEYKNKQYLIIGDINAWGKDNEEFLKKYRKDRAKNKIRVKALLTHSSRSINPTDKSLLREYRYLPEKYNFKSAIDIFNDKIFIVSPHLGSLAIVVAIPGMVDVFKAVFNIIWSGLPETK